MSMRMKISGLEGVQAALAELPKATAKNVVRRALLEAAEPMRDDAEQKAPVRFGDLAEGIKVTAKIVASQASDSDRPGKDEVRLFVGPNYQPGTEGYAPHAHLVEFGTGPRYHKSGKFVGQMPAQPFMRPAFDARKEDVIARYSAAIWEEIRKAVQRIARKNAKRGA